VLTEFRLRNFKGWADTGRIRLAPLTVFFGRNSSGKSSLLQAHLLMKQTAESLDTRRVLELGDPDAYVDLGTYRDVVRDHDIANAITLQFGWRADQPVELGAGKNAALADTFTFTTEIAAQETGSLRGQMYVKSLRYGLGADQARSVGLDAVPGGDYELVAEGLSLARRSGRPVTLPEPVKCYGFPDAVFNAYRNVDFLSDLSLRFDDLMSDISYVGPLRERPRRTYLWRGDRPAAVGPRGEDAVAAILAAAREKRTMGRRDQARGRPDRSFEANLGHWLKRLGIIESFDVAEIAPETSLYDLRVKVDSAAPTVSVADVGFGVSQVLPVLTQVFYARRGSTVLLEQPEIHLHPAAQSELGDALLAALRDNGTQLIVETHSEHLLRRLQRRVAEEAINKDDIALYVTRTKEGLPAVDELLVDDYGNITNWPDDFFGDELSDLTAMTEAGLTRRMGQA
jgi:predicted ATPase